MSRPFAQLPDKTQLTAFIRLYKEELNDTVTNLQEFCDSGENVERLINKLVPKPPPGGSDPPRNIRGLGISKIQNHRRYVLDLAVARGILTAAEKNDLGINSMDSHNTRPTGLLKLLEAITKRAGIRMEGYLPGATPSAPTPLTSYSRETGPAPAPPPSLSASRSAPTVTPSAPSYSRDSGPAPAPAQSFSRDSGPAPAPTQSFSRDSGPAPAPTQSFSRDSGPAPAPTQSFSRDSGAAPAPTQSFSRDSGAAPAPTQAFSRDSGAAPARVSPAASFGVSSGTTPKWALVQKRAALEDDRKNKVRRLETSLQVWKKCVQDLTRMLRAVSGEITPDAAEHVQTDFLRIAGPPDESSNPSVLLYRELVDTIDPELVDLYQKTGQGSVVPDPVPNPFDIFREIERLQKEIRPKFEGCVTPLQIAVQGVPAKFDELREAVAAVESQPNTRKLAIEKAHALLLKVVQLVKVDLPRAHQLSNFPQDRAAFNRRALEDELAPLQAEVETLVRNEERLARLHGDYQWDCISLDKDILVAEGICGNIPQTPTYMSVTDCLARLAEVQESILRSFGSATRLWRELEAISAGREIKLSNEKYLPDALAARVEQVKQELERTIAEMQGVLEGLAPEENEGFRPEENDDFGGGE